MTESDALTQSVQDRCPRMREHVGAHASPIPCPDCYSVRVTAERIPWEPQVRWHPITPPEGGDS